MRGQFVGGPLDGEEREHTGASIYWVKGYEQFFNFDGTPARIACPLILNPMGDDYGVYLRRDRDDAVVPAIYDWQR